MATVKLVDFDHVTDYISREAALACFHDWIDRYGHEHTADEMVEYQRIEELPVADAVEVVRGKWIRGNESRTSLTKDSYTCSVCGEKTLSGFCGNPAKTNFCPNCGADMRETNLDTTKGERRDESSG